jgi:hypothetical protein
MPSLDDIVDLYDFVVNGIDRKRRIDGFVVVP